MAAHTKGPWTVHQPGSVRACDGRHESDEGCRTLAEAEILGVPRAEAEANAQLIAAAPELLDVARAIVGALDATTFDVFIGTPQELQRLIDCRSAAVAAIAKVDGG